MYEWKNKFTQPAPILHKISIRYRLLSIVIFMKNAPLFLKSLILYGRFGKYKLSVLFETVSDAFFTFQNMPRIIYHSDSTLFSIASIHRYHLFMNDFYPTVSHENHLVNSAFLTDLFIRTKKNPKFCPIWALGRHFVSILQLFCIPYRGKKTRGKVTNFRRQ